MKMKIVADSSANLLALPDIDFGVILIKARHRHQAQVLTNGRMRLAMPMLSFVSPLQVPCPVHITVLLSLRTSMNRIMPAGKYMF